MKKITKLIFTVFISIITNTLFAQSAAWRVAESGTSGITVPKIGKVDVDSSAYVIAREKDGVITRQTGYLYGGENIVKKFYFDGRISTLAEMKNGKKKFDYNNWLSSDSRNNYIESPTGKSYIQLEGSFRSANPGTDRFGRDQYFAKYLDTNILRVYDSKNNLIRNIEIPCSGIYGLCFMVEPSRIALVMRHYQGAVTQGTVTNEHTNSWGDKSTEKREIRKNVFGYTIGVVDLVSGSFAVGPSSLYGDVESGIDAIGFFSSFAINEDLVVIGSALIDISESVVVKKFEKREHWEINGSAKIGFRLDDNRFVMDERVYSVEKLNLSKDSF